jgi:hypothetical protein
VRCRRARRRGCTAPGWACRSARRSTPPQTIANLSSAEAPCPRRAIRSRCASYAQRLGRRACGSAPTATQLFDACGAAGRAAGAGGCGGRGAAGDARQRRLTGAERRRRADLRRAGGELFLRVHWGAVPKAWRARRPNRRWRRWRPSSGVRAAAPPPPRCRRTGAAGGAGAPPAGGGRGGARRAASRFSASGVVSLWRLIPAGPGMTEILLRCRSFCGSGRVHGKPSSISRSFHFGSDHKIYHCVRQGGRRADATRCCAAPGRRTAPPVRHSVAAAIDAPLCVAAPPPRASNRRCWAAAVCVQRYGRGWLARRPATPPPPPRPTPPPTTRRRPGTTPGSSPRIMIGSQWVQTLRHGDPITPTEISRIPCWQLTAMTLH